MAKRRKKPSPPKIAKALPLGLFLFITLVGIVFGLFDHYGLLTYRQVSSFFRLADSPAETLNAELSVHFIDVGQGDCSLIRSGDTTVLIDGGELGSEEKIKSYLEAQNITRLDYVIATHPHSDHIGGLPEILGDFDIGQIILPKVPDSIVPTTQIYEKLLLAIQEKGLKITRAVPGTEYDLGGMSKLKLLGPLSEDSDNLNNYSIVCRLVSGDNSFLFTGDAEKEEEEDLLISGEDLRADVLKVAHHGSNSSSTTAFLNAVKPEYCMISVGAENSYGHPGAEAVGRLEKFTGEIYRTDLLGTIVAHWDGNGLTFTTEKG